MRIVKEAKEKEFETDVEQKLKRKLLALLRDDGRGHRHAKYAARLKDFLLKIIPRDEDPGFTAAISWQDDTVYVSSGFVTNDPNLFYQLSVLMRHELAHNLMCHEIRMMHKIVDKYGDKYYTHIKMSQSIHQLLNVIEDFEISNKRYTAEDKVTVQNMLIGGEIITGLVTESHRKDWINLTVEQMYDELEKEISKVQARILAMFDALDLGDKSLGASDDFITREIVTNLSRYADSKHPTNFLGTLDDFLDNKALYHFALFDKVNGRTGQIVAPCIVKYSSLPDVYQELLESIAAEFTESNGYVKQDLRDRVVDIAKSSPLARFDVIAKLGYVVTELYTPEEKFIAIDALKAIIPTLEEYNTWYGKVKKTLSDPKFAKDLQRIYDEVSA